MYTKRIFKNFNVISVIATIVIITGVLIGCQKDCSAITTVDSQKANEIAQEYIVLKSNHYVLNLSKKEAISLGISKSDYDRMQMEIRQINAHIDECLTNGIEMTIEDPQTTRLKGGNLPDPEPEKEIIGSFKMPATGEGGSITIWIPFDVTEITINASTTCLLTNAYGAIYGAGFQTIYYSMTGLTPSKTINIGSGSGGGRWITVTGNTPCSDGGRVSILTQVRAFMNLL